jgi:hypothetical protein
MVSPRIAASRTFPSAIWSAWRGADRGLHVRGSAWVAACLLAACEPEPKEAPSVNVPSPNASILPAPLAAGDAQVRTPADAGLDAAVEPSPYPYDEPLAADGPLQHDLPGVSLNARFAWDNTGGAGESSADAIQAAKRETSFDVVLDLTSVGRMRVVLDSDAFVLPKGTELRARQDRWGHVLVWPDGASYRALAPGTLRALLADGRVDVMPVTAVTVSAGAAGNLLGKRTEQSRVTTPYGNLNMDRAVLPELGTSGQLVCRLLIELAGGDPASSACGEASVPLRASFTWPTGGKLDFEVRSIEAHPNFDERPFLVPPAQATLRASGIPPRGALRLLVDEERLRKFRPRGTLSGELEVTSDLTEAVYVLIDSAPVGWLGPQQRLAIPGLKTGSYRVSWRDFFGTNVSEKPNVTVPGRLALGTRPEAPEAH